MTFLAGLAIVFVTAGVVLWINDNTELGGDYLSEDDRPVG
jgi:hypothetical protein